MPPEILSRRAAPPHGWRRFELAAFAAGTALLVWLLARVGPAELARNLSAVGWGFVAVLGLQAVAFLLNTLSWAFQLPPDREVPLSALAPMLVAGEAVNAVSPVGFVGGELVRVSLLRRRLPAGEAVAAVARAAMAQFAGQVLFILLGLPVAVHLVLSPEVRASLDFAGAAAGLLLAVVLALAFSKGGLRAAGRALEHFGALRRLAARVPESAREAGRRGLEALRRHPSRFLASALLSFGAWQVGVAETLLVLRWLGRPVSFGLAVAIEVLAVAIEGALFFVPAKMGTQEGGRVLIFLALGLDPALGLALGLVRRARDLAWAVPGLAVLGAFRRSAPPVLPWPAAPVTRGGRPLPD